MKYNIFTHGMFTHYVPKQSKWSVACDKAVALLVMTFPGTLLAYAILISLTK